MSVVFVVVVVMLVIGAFCAIVRTERGPSMLDRTVALDVFTTTLVAAIALEAAYSRRATSVPILVVLSLVAFVGSTTVARFAAVEREDEGRVQTPAEAAAEDARRRVLEAAEDERRERERRRRAEAEEAAARTPGDGHDETDAAASGDGPPEDLHGDPDREGPTAEGEVR